MSNKSVFKLCLVIALTISATSAFGATSITSGTQIGGGTFSPSNNVTISYDAGPAGNATQYSASAKHGSGDRVIATNSTDPKMWWKKVAVTASLTAAVSTDTFSSAAWTSM